MPSRLVRRLTTLAVVNLLLETVRRATAVRVPRMAAALTFYLLLSAAPLLVVVVGVAGLVVGQRATGVYEELLAALAEHVGQRAAGVIAGAVEGQTQRRAEGLVTTGVGLFALLWSASRAFNEFQDALNTVWDVAPPAGIRPGVLRTVRQRALSFALTIAAGVTLTIYVLVRPTIDTYGQLLASLAPAAVDVVSALNALFAFLLITAVLAGLYRFLPETRLRWSDVWLGSLLAALVLTVGQLAFGAYLRYARQLGFLGAASSPLVVLALTHAAIQAVYYGAVLSRAYSLRLGSRAAAAARGSGDSAAEAPPGRP